jgi:hypothetical protein
MYGMQVFIPAVACFDSTDETYLGLNRRCCEKLLAAASLRRAEEGLLPPPSLSIHLYILYLRVQSAA